METRWTGGQFSLIRAMIGLGLMLAFAWTLVMHWSAGGWQERVVGAAGIPLSVALAMGIQRRAAAVGLLGPMVVLSLPALPQGFVSLAMLLSVSLAMFVIPTAPFGSWPARGRVDPGGSWEMPPLLMRGILIALAAGHLLLGSLGLLGQLGSPANPLATLTWIAQVVFAPAVCLRRVRPFAWLVVLPLLVVCVGEPLPGVGVILLHILAFDPRWVRPLGVGEREMVFYDGHCGLCHGAVRFTLAEDTAGVFRFAPLRSAAFNRCVVESELGALSDSIVVQRSDGALLVRSTAVVHLLRRLGGAWGAVGVALELIPTPIRDLGYRAVAAVRHRIFQEPQGVCPLVPERLVDRFALR